jgi:hypothetical protein
MDSGKEVAGPASTSPLMHSVPHWYGFMPSSGMAGAGPWNSLPLYDTMAAFNLWKRFKIQNLHDCIIDNKVIVFNLVWNAANSWSRSTSFINEGAKKLISFWSVYVECHWIASSKTKGYIQSTTIWIYGHNWVREDW